MNWLLMSRMSALSLALASLGLVTGCEESPSAKNPPGVTPQTHSPATAEDVQRESSEAAQATKEYLGEKKDEFAAEMSKKLEQLDAKMADMNVEGEKLKGEAKVKWDAAMEDLKVKREEMSIRLEGMKQSSGEAWEDFKAGLEKSGNEIESAAQDAKDKFNEKTSSDEPPATEDP